MWRSILVPLDGTDFGESALPYALRLARKANAELRLVHVFPPGEATNKAARIAAYVRKLGVRADHLGGVPVRVDVLDGPIEERLGAYAGATPCDLIVLSTHGRGTLGRLWFGSVADVIVRSAPCPVLTVRPACHGSAGTCETVRRIVVPLDGSPYSEGILPAAEGRADLFAASIILVRVLEPSIVMHPTPLAWTRPLTNWGQTPTFDLNGARAPTSCASQVDSGLLSNWSHAGKYLGEIAGRLSLTGRQVATRVAFHENPATAILEESQPDVAIVLRTHPQGDVDCFRLGHVAGPIFHEAVGPVLIGHSYPLRSENLNGVRDQPSAAQVATCKAG